MKYCGKCGAGNPDGAGFCGACGEPLAPAAAKDRPVAGNKALPARTGRISLPTIAYLIVALVLAVRIFLPGGERKPEGWIEDAGLRTESGIFDMNGLALGMSPDDAERVLSDYEKVTDGAMTDSGRGRVLAYKGTEYLGREAGLGLGFGDSGLYMVSYGVSRDTMEDVRRQLTDMYGEPGSVSEGAVWTLHGGVSVLVGEASGGYVVTWFDKDREVKS